MEKRHQDHEKEHAPDFISGSAGLDDKAKENRPREIGGREGPDPTRYGDWEKNGRCIDF